MRNQSRFLRYGYYNWWIHGYLGKFNALDSVNADWEPGRVLAPEDMYGVDEHPSMASIRAPDIARSDSSHAVGV